MAKIPILLVISVALRLSDATESSDRLTMDLATFIEDEHLNHATVGVMLDGKLVYSQGLVRESRKEVNVRTPKPVPAIGMSHLIASLAILRLTEDGFVDLEQMVFENTGVLADYIKKKDPVTDPRVAEVKLVHLLQQTVGWSMDFSKWSRNTFPGDLIKSAMKEELLWNPGERYKYSVFNEYLLRIIVELHWQTSYEDFVKQNIMVPLGMFHSRLDHQLSTKDDIMDVPLDMADLDIPLLPSIWHLSVYDTMRLISSIDGSKSLLMSWNSLKQIYERPKQPSAQHTDSWQGMGVFVKNDGSFWIESSQNTHYIFLYNSGSELTRTSSKHQRQPEGAQLCIFAHMQGKHIAGYKQDVMDLVMRVDSWPELDIITGDLFDSKLGTKALRYRISEHHLAAYVSAVRHAGYQPIWFSAYENGGNTFFSVISEKSNSVDDQDWLFEHGLLTPRYKKRVENLEMDGFQLKLTQTYICQSHSGLICHAILMWKLPEEQRVAYIHLYEHMTEYIEDAGHYFKKDYVPTVQSVTSRMGHTHVSAILHLADPKEYKPYLDLELRNLETTIHKEVVQERGLAYLDPYIKKGEVMFSAVFKSVNPRPWVMQQDLKPDEIKHEVEELRKTGYFPEIIVGYEVDRELYYTAMYYEQ